MRDATDPPYAPPAPKPPDTLRCSVVIRGCGHPCIEAPHDGPLSVCLEADRHVDEGDCSFLEERGKMLEGRGAVGHPGPEEGVLLPAAVSPVSEDSENRQDCAGEPERAVVVDGGIDAHVPGLGVVLDREHGFRSSLGLVSPRRSAVAAGGFSGIGPSRYPAFFGAGSSGLPSAAMSISFSSRA